MWFWINKQTKHKRLADPVAWSVSRFGKRCTKTAYRTSWWNNEPHWFKVHTKLRNSVSYIPKIDVWDTVYMTNKQIQENRSRRWLMKQKKQGLNVQSLVKQYDTMISRIKKNKLLTDPGGGSMRRLNRMKAVGENQPSCWISDSIQIDKHTKDKSWLADLDSGFLSWLEKAKKDQ